MDVQVVQLDVKTTILYADIEAAVFVETEAGFEKTDKDGVQHLLKLGKDLNGLAQSLGNWW